jgi:hypothetical protein
MSGTSTPAPLSSPSAAEGLSEREHDVLAFERQWWKYAGAKEAAIKDLFGMSATRYYQVLNALIDKPEALVADPMLVKAPAGRLRSTRQRTPLGRGRLGLDA